MRCEVARHLCRFASILASCSETAYGRTARLLRPIRCTRRSVRAARGLGRDDERRRRYEEPRATRRRRLRAGLGRRAEADDRRGSRPRCSAPSTDVPWAALRDYRAPDRALRARGSDPARCLSDASRSPHRHRHVPLHGRRGLDEAAARARAPRRTPRRWPSIAALIREACAAEGGVEVDTQGDAFFFAFPTAPGALAAAEAMTDALATGPSRCGSACTRARRSSTDEGYIGDDVHFGARIAASATAARSCSRASHRRARRARADRPRRAPAQGHPEAVPIFQLGDGSFPPLKTISNTNLPRPASSFVGRDDELLEVLSRFEDGARLVTLTGPGGTGKTRLAIEAAATLVPEYKAGVFWVGLATLRDPALVTETIARRSAPRTARRAHRRPRDAAPARQPRAGDRRGARALRAPHGLSQPRRCSSRAASCCASRARSSTPCRRSPSRRQSRSSARARSSSPTRTIAELCRRLDDLPLAVELAAARTSALTPQQILERLSQRLDLLKGGRDADPRQQTLRATIEWSYELLSLRSSSSSLASPSSPAAAPWRRRGGLRRRPRHPPVARREEPAALHGRAATGCWRRSGSSRSERLLCRGLGACASRACRAYHMLVLAQGARERDPGSRRWLSALDGSTTTSARPSALSRRRGNKARGTALSSALTGRSGTIRGHSARHADGRPRAHERRHRLSCGLSVLASAAGFIRRVAIVTCHDLCGASSRERLVTLTSRVSSRCALHELGPCRLRATLIAQRSFTSRLLLLPAGWRDRCRYDRKPRRCSIAAQRGDFETAVAYSRQAIELVETGTEGSGSHRLDEFNLASALIHL